VKHKPNEKVKLKFYRSNKVREVSVLLEELPRLKNMPGGVI
jgi:S1-C subfamily serine protease